MLFMRIHNQAALQWRLTPSLACMKMILEILVIFLSKNIYSYEAFESRTLNENVLVGNFLALTRLCVYLEFSMNELS